MMMGLKEGQEKMSKSDPDSAIFMEDDAADVKRKIKQSFCPPGVAEGNPCLDWMQHIVFGRHADEGVTVRRKPADGGDKLYARYADLEADFVAGTLHPGDLKACLTEYINACVGAARRGAAAQAESARRRRTHAGARPSLARTTRPTLALRGPARPPPSQHAATGARPLCARRAEEVAGSGALVQGHAMRSTGGEGAGRVSGLQMERSRGE